MTVTSKSMRVFLVASLALNAFLLAIAATLWFARDDGHRHGRGDLMPSPRRLLAQLEPEDRAKLEDFLQQRRGRMRGEIGRVMAARNDVATALRAQPYDRAKAEAAFTTLRAQADSLTKRAQDAVLDIADRLDDAGRARLAEAIDNEHRAWREHARRRHAQRQRDRGPPPADAPATDTPPTPPIP